MNVDILVQLAPATLLVAVLITLFSGIVKGAVGFAMPLIIVSGLSSLIDPKLAIASIILPIVISNGLQTFRHGLTPAIKAAKEHWRYILIVCVMIFATAQLVPFIPTTALYVVLGVPIVLLSLIQLLGFRLTIMPSQKSWAEWIIAIISGTLGGLAGTWAPTTVLYLLAINTPKTSQIVVQGVIFGVSSLTILVAHIQSGILNAHTTPFSVLLVPFALAGMWIGFHIQDRLNADRFRQITLIVLAIAGLNLLRKGLMG